MEAAIALNERRLPLVFFGGYSGSGKTTHCIPILRSFGYRILSSSVLLHEFSERLITRVFGCDYYDSYDRELELSVVTQVSDPQSGWFNHGSVISKYKYQVKSRKFLIDLAEDALIPAFGKEVFMSTIADSICQNPNVSYAVEIFDANEFTLLQKLLKNRGISEDFFVFNLRRRTENSVVDRRTLIPGGVNIHNNGSYAELEEDLRLKLGEKKLTCVSEKSL